MPRRVAFLTPEYPSDGRRSGGVASYVSKMAKALTTDGFEVEVFVPDRGTGSATRDGVIVHRVARTRCWALRALARGLRPLLRSRSELALELVNARRLAAALERRHAEAPFDVIQSANHQLTGYYVRARAGRRHLIRVSTSRRLYDGGNGWLGRWAARLAEALDVAAMRRADAVYAPSRLLADHFRATHGLDVRVVRPPVERLDVAAAPREDHGERYLVHFGTLGGRKGTDALATALPLAWAAAPDLRVVWIGPLDEHAWRAYRATWGDAADRVTWIGPQTRERVLAVVAGAVAAVLPSRIDNLPNTVIESLELGVPVIGTIGTSIDELVVEGESGTLVPVDDAEALARAMVAAWLGQVDWVGRGFRRPAMLDEMLPGEALRRWRDLADEPQR